MKSKTLAFRLAWAAKPLSAYHAYDPRSRRTRLPGPCRVQIQTVNRCNGGCVMCPYAGGNGQARLMDDDLYADIIAQLAAGGSVGMFAPMLQNEPLLDVRLSERVTIARRAFGPRTRIVVVTNGSVMTDDRVRSLVEAGVDTIAVSLDAFTRETYEAIRPGLDFERVKENALGLLRYRDRITIHIRFLVQQLNRAEQPAFRHFWKSRGATVQVHEVANRAATLGSYEEVYASQGRRVRHLLRDFAKRAGGRLYPACAQPFMAMAVLVDGRVLACCHDWGPKEVVGDLSRESLGDVWNGREVNRIRHLLVAREFERSPACRGCSVVQKCATPFRQRGGAHPTARAKREC